MSLFSEVLNAQQAQVDEPRRMQEFLQQQAMNKQLMQQRALQDQRAVQEQQINMGQMQRQNQLQDLQRGQGAEGSGAFAEYFRNQPQSQGVPMQGPMPNGQTMQGAGIGPNVSPTQVMPKPEMQPMTLQSVAQSIYKQNPKISPEGFVAALERFQPILDSQSKIQLAQIKSQNVNSGKLDIIAYNAAKASGASEEDAIQAGIAAKRAAPEEVGLAAEAKGRAKTTVAREAGLAKAQSSLAGLKQQAGLVTDTIDKALNAITPYSTGYGSLLSVLPNSESRKLKNYLDTIKANVSFDKLQAMREASPTGGALGQVSDFENRLLQATQGVLDPAQSDQLSENLKTIKDLYPKVLAERERAFNQDYGSAQKQRGSESAELSPTSPSSTMDFNQLPE